MVAGQPYKHLLDPDQTAKMIKFAVRKPHMNAESIVAKGFQTIGIDAKQNPTLVRDQLTVRLFLANAFFRLISESK